MKQIKKQQGNKLKSNILIISLNVNDLHTSNSKSQKQSDLIKNKIQIYTFYKKFTLI